MPLELRQVGVEVVLLLQLPLLSMLCRDAAKTLKVADQENVARSRQADVVNRLCVRFLSHLASRAGIVGFIYSWSNCVDCRHNFTAKLSHSIVTCDAMQPHCISQTPQLLSTRCVDSFLLGGCLLRFPAIVCTTAPLCFRICNTTRIKRAHLITIRTTLG